MKIIEQLCDMINEELDDAEKYATCALHHKDDNKQLADTFYTLSTEEIKHSNMLHEQVVSIINEYKKAHGNPPVEMMAVYDYLHRKSMEHAADIRAMQMTYKE